MNICLIDADSIIPNLALMKISSYYKNKGDYVSLVKANIPYFPNKKKKVFIAPNGFDKYYCSVVFNGNAEYVKGDNIEFGGSGVDIKKILPLEIENLIPDYSIYPDNNISYGFLSRGCIRNCSFCIVPEKEGKIRQVSSVDNIIKHKIVKFLDNNFLALPNHKEILKELICKKIKFQFNQGLDIRLVDEENSNLLSKCNYFGEYIFAFDDYSYLRLIEEKLNIMTWRKKWQFKFFVYINPDMEIKNIVKRIIWLKENECLPYIMRDISCWESRYNEFYIDIAAYCNQPNLFKKISFEYFLNKRHKNPFRINKSLSLYKENI